MRKTSLFTAVFIFFLLLTPAAASGADSPLRVGIMSGWSDTALLAAMREEKDIHASIVMRLRMGTLDEYDVLIITQQPNPGAVLRRRTIDMLVNWVNGGGGALFLHDAVGYREHEPVFPAVGKGVYHPKKDILKIARKHPVTEGIPAGGKFSPGFRYDHVIIETGPSGETLVENENGEPVVVAGKSGEGRVVLNGMLTGHHGDAADSMGTAGEPGGKERKIFMNAVRWLGGRG